MDIIKFFRAGKILPFFMFFTLSISMFAKPILLSFDNLYSGYSVTGLQISDEVLSAQGEEVVMEGFMAPPLKADANFFVLTKTPMAICPFCSSDADWPEDIIVVYLQKRQTFVQYNSIIKVKGILEIGSKIDEKTGFVSLMRIVDAKFEEIK